jgi:hypothetical protein
MTDPMEFRKVWEGREREQTAGEGGTGLRANLYIDIKA